MTQAAGRLVPEESDRIYERQIQPDMFVGALASSAPVALIIAGQPGAGVPAAAAVLRRELIRTAGAAAHLSAQRLRDYHPAWRDHDDTIPAFAARLQSDVNHWFNRAIQDAQKQRLHMMVEDELQEAKSINRLAVGLRKDGYVVQAVFVSTHPDLSRISLMARYDIWRERGMTPAFVTAQEHEAALANLRSAIILLEDRRSVDGMRVIERDGSQLYDNRVVEGEWLRAPRAQAILDLARDRALPPREIVKLAMQWETLVQRLAHDPAVPREVASQVLGWRNDMVARCEAIPATAQLLQWAREGAAFRTMDRFEFEKEFPHHARAVKLLGLAVIEAEKYEAPESARFLASARENIAQRIERGDMARIALRQKAKDAPTR